jgi:hypothetical protein
MVQPADRNGEPIADLARAVALADRFADDNDSLGVDLR